MFWLYYYLTLAMPVISSLDVRENCARAQLVLFILIAIKKLKGEHLFIGLTTLYYVLSDWAWGGVNSTQLLIETPLIIAWALYLHMRPKLETKTYNPKTVHLAFYKGDHASFRMRLAELIDLPVTSVCLAWGDKAVRLKDGVFTEVPSSSITNSENYVLVDTGVKPSKEFKDNIITIVGAQRKEGIINSSCIETIEPCLKELGSEYIPSNWFEKLPSKYLRKVLKIKRASSSTHKRRNE